MFQAYVKLIRREDDEIREKIYIHLRFFIDLDFPDSCCCI